MTCKQLAEEYRWWRAECATIAAYAQERGYPVVPDMVAYNLGDWRDWYYGLCDDEVIEVITGARKRGVTADDATAAR